MDFERRPGYGECKSQSGPDSAKQMDSTTVRWRPLGPPGSYGFLKGRGRDW